MNYTLIFALGHKYELHRIANLIPVIIEPSASDYCCKVATDNVSEEDLVMIKLKFDVTICTQDEYNRLRQESHLAISLANKQFRQTNYGAIDVLYCSMYPHPSELQKVIDTASAYIVSPTDISLEHLLGSRHIRFSQQF